MLHKFLILEFKTSFRLNKSYGLVIHAEMMNRADIFSPMKDLTVGFARHTRIVFVLRGRNPGGAEQRQAGKEVEEGHQTEH